MMLGLLEVSDAGGMTGVATEPRGFQGCAVGVDGSAILDCEEPIAIV